MSVSAFSWDVKHTIFERAEGRCEWCWLAAPDGDFHHRCARGMGGSLDEVLGRAGNGVLLHRGCHNYLEANPDRARALGFRVDQGIDPKTVPIRLLTGWVLLDDLGGVVGTDDPVTVVATG